MIRILVMDVDGTLTDGKLYYGENGETFKAFDVKDGYGIKNILPCYDIIPVIITARTSSFLERRCRELGIVHLYQGVHEKKELLDDVITKIASDRDETWNYSNVAYIGDDILDLQCMLPIGENGGLIGCPGDAVEEVKRVAHFVSTRNGGCGAVREFINYIVAMASLDGCNIRHY